MSKVVIDSNSHEMAKRNNVDIESSRPDLQTKSHSWKATGKHSMTWKGLAWEVDVKKRGSSLSTPKKIIKGVSGYVESGNILAIMGPSGSGKTSLLDILADRAGSGRVTGDILLDGKPRTPEYVASYVAQEDSLLGAFTTKETLMYTAGLTLKTDIKVADREQLVLDLIKDLGLEVCANTRVGDVFVKGLSGGQKRRLSLGLALITRPALMLLDEPTSGLDAASAQGIMKLVSSLASEKHIAIACTIHQPSSDIWNLFDKLSLMVAGEQVFFGAARDAVNYFTSIGYVCPAYSNPADYFLTLINTDFDGHADMKALVEEFKKHQEAAAQDSIEARITAIVAEDSLNPPFSNVNKNNSLNQFLFLLHRNFMNTYRNPGVIVVRLIMYAMLSVMIGGMFWENGHETTDKAIQGRIACLFYVFAFMVFMSIAVLPFYMWDRSTYLRERFNGDYAVLPFVAAQFMSTAPGVFLIALVSSVIVVHMCAWNNFGYFLLVMFLALMTAEGYMAFLSAIVPHFIIGIALGAGMYGFFMLSEGFFQIRSDIPPWFIWVYFMGFHTYAFRAAVVNEFKDRGVMTDAANPSWGSGADILKYYDMENGSVSDDCWTLFGYCLAFFLLYYVALVKTTGKR